ncbi:MAG: ATP-binding protein, partial [Calditrichaeota bacterium]|nr:ATP-binding protein [Calditrichota bacterium]
QWGQDGERIRNLRRNTDMAIYTPGSSAGLPVSILKSFAAPDSKLLEDLDLLRDRIQTTASGILELLGMKVDPLQSREHILLANIIEHSWMAGKDLDLGSLIQLIQNPPIERIGVFDLESFYPAKERFKLSMTLNNLLAAPGFQSWLEGEALDVGSMLYTPSGTPRTSIFSIAHLSDAERMFFVTLLLNQILGWMRTQSG